MSDTSPKRRRRCSENPEEIYRLLREHFALARFGGPSLCRKLHEPGDLWKLYVGELSQWLWLPTADGLRLRRHPHLRSRIPRNGSTSRCGESAQERATAAGIRPLSGTFGADSEWTAFAADLGAYLTNDIALMVDAIALRGRSYRGAGLGSDATQLQPCGGE